MTSSLQALDCYMVHEDLPLLAVPVIPNLALASFSDATRPLDVIDNPSALKVLPPMATVPADPWLWLMPIVLVERSLTSPVLGSVWVWSTVTVRDMEVPPSSDRTPALPERTVTGPGLTTANDLVTSTSLCSNFRFSKLAAVAEGTVNRVVAVAIIITSSMASSAKVDLAIVAT
jgi:hypothetical protein